MATTSEVIAGVDDMCKEIRTARAGLAKAKAMVTTYKNQLANIPTKYSDVISTIDGYTGGTPFEDAYKDRKDRLASEFVPLKNDAAQAESDMGALTEF